MVKKNEKDHILKTYLILYNDRTNLRKIIIRKKIIR